MRGRSLTSLCLLQRAIDDGSALWPVEDRTLRRDLPSFGAPSVPYRNSRQVEIRDRDRLPATWSAGRVDCLSVVTLVGVEVVLLRLRAGSRAYEAFAGSWSSSSRDGDECISTVSGIGNFACSARSLLEAEVLGIYTGRTVQSPDARKSRS